MRPSYVDGQSYCEKCWEKWNQQHGRRHERRPRRQRKLRAGVAGDFETKTSAHRQANGSLENGESTTEGSLGDSSLPGFVTGGVEASGKSDSEKSMEVGNSAPMLSRGSDSGGTEKTSASQEDGVPKHSTMICVSFKNLAIADPVAAEAECIRRRYPRSFEWVSDAQPRPFRFVMVPSDAELGSGPLKTGIPIDVTLPDEYPAAPARVKVKGTTSVSGSLVQLVEKICAAGCASAARARRCDLRSVFRELDRLLPSIVKRAQSDALETINWLCTRPS